MKITAWAVVVVALVAGCGGGSSGSPRPSATSVADRIHCQGYTPTDGGPELFAATQGDCMVGGASVSVLTFASKDAENKWVSAAQQVTGGDGTLVIGDLFAVEANDADQADKIAAQVHGKVQ